MATITVVAFFTFCTFLANIVFSALGFGQAILFLFLYHLGEISGILDCCNLRYAVFIQTITFAVVVPFTLWRFGVVKNTRAELIIGFVPLTLAGTPLGSYLQDYTPVPILKIIVGTISMIVAVKQIYGSIRSYLDSRAKPMENVDVEAGMETVIENNNVTLEDKDNIAKTEDDRNVVEMPNVVTIREDEKRETIGEKNLIEMLKEMLKHICAMRVRFFWMLMTGFLGGVLGGLVGARGIPFIVFFFMFEYPPAEVKANATIVAAINVAIRVITYISKSPPQDYPYASWFDLQDGYLYLCVTVIGSAGIPLGLWITKHIKQEHFKLGLAFLLIVNGVSMVVMGSLSV